ncbi:type II toxin-antitoxin system RelE family toxin [Streptomyces marincola]|uniref:type II toxin-antitoxin system RelE family toxin n=1 Tax=Streptomyces marincola TaxID=2878388 RepID=UPI001CF57731|nr:type II toxin-antitoxin system RelE/ParE family toxin [Streptomyces marincola]UCM89399.1 type II toxin-antitoxin system RelE/ParE family toxin [Streptomyces marincola]
MSYRLAFTSTAQRQLRRLDDATKRRIKAALDKLARDPYAPALDIKKLRGRDEEYRLRVGDYRVVYGIANAVLTITVIDVDHRRDIYR